METTPFILSEFKAFTLQTKIAEIKHFFHETTFSHFPIVKNKQLIGLISETDVFGIDEEAAEIGNFQHLFNLFFVEENTNLLEILKEFASNETNLIPVINTNKEYVGYYDLIDTLHTYNDTSFLKNEGTILTIEKKLKDFSFSQVCQIVESNNGKVLGLFVLESNAEKVKLIIKFSSQDINEIIQSFRRFNYSVISKHKDDFYLEDLKERSNYLQKYLNI